MSIFELNYLVFIAISIMSKKLSDEGQALKLSLVF